MLLLFSTTDACRSAATRSPAPPAEGTTETARRTDQRPDGGAGHHRGADGGAHHAHGVDGGARHARGADGFHRDFSDVERFAKHFDTKARDVWQKPREVLRLLEVHPADIVADLGTGTGYFVPYLSRAVGPSGHVLALDVEPKMVEYVRRRAETERLVNVEARRVPFDDPGLAASSVDRILIVNTWHHIDDREHYSAKLRRALRDMGFVLVVDFTEDSDIGPPPQHRLPARRVVEELSAGGFSARVLEETLPKQYVVRADRRAAGGG